MNGIKRAGLYVLRKRRRSVWMLLLLVVITTTLLTCLALYGGIQNAMKQARQSMEARLIISGSSFSKAQQDAIARLDGAIEVNATSGGMARYLNISGAPLDTISMGGAAVADYEHCGILRGNTASELDEDFHKRLLKLMEGRHITNADGSVALLHQSLAEENGLRLGDTFLLESADVNGAGSVEVEIVGLFVHSETQPGGLLMDHQLYENRVYTSLGVFNQIAKGAQGTEGEKLIISVQDPAFLDTLIEAIRGTAPPQEATRWMFQKEDLLYRQAIAPLERGKGFMAALAWVIGVISLVALTLLLILNVRGRSHETAVLRAMGITGSSILGQLLVENLLLFLAGLPVALVGAGTMIKLVGQKLADGAGGDLSVGITAYDLGITVLALILVIVSGAVLAFLPDSRQNPKKQIL